MRRVLKERVNAEEQQKEEERAKRVEGKAKL